MTYAAEVLADSISPDGVRLTTLYVTFPRFILAEVNTHRMLSRNSNSSRAIPPERQIAKVLDSPFVPETFGKRVKGMGVGKALDVEEAEMARIIWLAARDDAVTAAKNLLRLDCDKSRINRLLEPFLWHSAVISATEWSNFFALRDHPAAQPEFQITAQLMRVAMYQSIPVGLDYDQWHLPGVTKDELAVLCEAPEQVGLWKKVSAGRLARWTSYDRLDDDPPEAALARAEKLIASFHMSPTEHQARPADPSRDKHGEDGVEVEFYGNFMGWVQYRKEIPNEHNAALAEALA